MGKLLTIKEAAKIKKVSVDRIRTAIKHEILHPVRLLTGLIQVTTFIDSDELARWDGQLRPPQKEWKPFAELVKKYKVNYRKARQAIIDLQIPYVKMGSGGRLFVREVDFVDMLRVRRLS